MNFGQIRNVHRLGGKHGGYYGYEYCLIIGDSSNVVNDTYKVNFSRNRFKYFVDKSELYIWSIT